MTRSRFGITAVAGALTLAAAAPAKDVWQTVTLRGEPGLTISIPAAAVNKPDETDPDDLMFFSVNAGLHATLTCLASRAAYFENMPRADFAAGLATERRVAFCKRDGGTVRGAKVIASESFEHAGSQAAVCTASFTDSAKKSPGRVQSQMVVTAPAKAYFLTCIVEDEDQEAAEIEWTTFWGEKVRHIQASFRLPR